MGFTERGKVQVDYRATGLDTLSKAANIITGINQGLELMRKGLELTGRATKQFIDTGSQFERYNVQFKTLLGTMDAAQNRMEELFTFATRTPFDLPEVVEAAQKLEAYGIYSERALTDVGDAAAAMGKTLEQGVEAIADSSRGELERLKEFGISAAELTAKMGHEINRGTVEGLKELQETVLGIFAERYGGGMEALSQTLGGMISNLRGRWIEFKKEVADAGAFQTVKDIVSAIMKSVDRLFDSGQGQRLAQVVGDTIANAMLDATRALVRVALRVYELALNVKDLADKIAGPAEAVGAGAGWLGRQLAYGSEHLSGAYMYGAGAAQRRRGGAGRSYRLDDEVQTFLRGLLESLDAIKVGGGGPGLGLAGESAGAPARRAGAAGMETTGLDLESAREQRIELSQVEIDQAYAVLDAWADVHRALTIGWDKYYTHIAKAAQKWGKLEKANIRDIARAMGEGARASLVALIDTQAQVFGRKAIEHGLAAAGSLAYGNFAAAAKHAAIATGYTAAGAAAGIAAGFAMKGAGSDYDSGGDYGGDMGGTDSTKSRTVSRSVGITTQNLTIHMNIYHQGATFYGEGGEREFWYDHLLPLAQESLETGALGA